MSDPSLPAWLGRKVSRVAALMQRDFETRLDGRATRMEWAALASIGLEGAASPSALALHLGVARPAASRLLRAMERDGLVTRREAERDGRGVTLSLTEAGQALLKDLLPSAEQTRSRFAGKLAPDELAELHRLLDKLAEGEPDAVTRL